MKHVNPMRKLLSLSIVLAAIFSATVPNPARAAFTIGNLAVESLTSNLTSSTFSIIELSPYHTNSTPVNTIAIPSTGASALRQSSSGSTGRLALTQDRTLLAFTGAEDPVGVADETTISNRGVGTVDANGHYALQASYMGLGGSTANQARGATSLDDKTWIFADKGGIYTNNTGTTPLNTTNVRPIKCFGGALYALTQNKNTPPTVIAQVSANGMWLTNLPGLPADNSAVDFYMIASGNDGVTNDILYVNDGKTFTKYSLVSGSWTLNGSANFGGGLTADGFCAIGNGTGANLYVTTGASGSVVEATDAAGYNAPPMVTTNNDSVLYTGGVFLKGIDFAPIPNLAAEQLAQNTTSSQFSIVELNPYLSNAVPVNTIVIPTNGSSALRQANNASTGRLALTGDRTLLAFSAIQDSNGVSDEETINLRGVGTIDSTAGGDYTLQTTYTGLGGSTDNQTRSATSLNNVIWYVGDKGGVYTNNTVNPLNVTNVRPIKVFGGTLYACAATSKNAPNIIVVNTLSTDGTQLTPLPGLPSDANALDFYMIQSGVNGTNYDILYVNDYGGNPTVISKYSLVSGSWTLNGTATVGAGITPDGICALNIGGGANLYMTTGTPGAVVEVTDTTGYNAAPVFGTANTLTLYTNAVYLKGIDFAPVGGVSSSLNTPPVITPDPAATVDRPFTNTFVDDPVWRTTITNITVNSITLPASAYNTNRPGEVIFTPSASALLQSSGTKTIVYSAFGYNADAVVQSIAGGAATALTITVQPAAPAGDGGTLVVQPALALTDQYGNPANNNSAVMTASSATGAWVFGPGSGTNQTAASGAFTFTNLSALSGTAVGGATITFTVSGAGLGSLPYTTTNSAAFAIPAPPATGFTAGNLAVLQEDIAAKNSTMSILELSPTIANQAAPVNTFPVSATGTNALRQSSAGTTGRMADSDDGTLVCFTGFEDGSSATADETTVNPRGVGTFNAGGNFTLQTSYIGLGGSTGNQTRSATTIDDTNYYIGDKGGVYINNGVNPFIGGTANNVRSLKSFNGTVYALQQSSSSVTATVLQIVPRTDGSIWLYGSEVLSGYEAYYPVDGFPQDPSVVDFYMVQSGNNGVTNDVVYYLDDTNSTSGALYKYYLNGTDDNGLPAYTLAGSWTTPNGGDGLCVATNANGGFDLYYTTGGGGDASNKVVMVHDSGAWDEPINLTSTNILYTASPRATMKGITFAPVLAQGAPEAVTLTASNLTSSGAMLNGSVNPNGNATAYWFAYGPTPAYGSVTATNTLAAGSSPVIVTAALSGLPHGSVYHYQLIATNIVSGSQGSDLIFALPTVTSIRLNSIAFNSGGSLVSFTNSPGASFTVWATTNIALTFPSQWQSLGHPTETPDGAYSTYQFTDTQATNNATRFYRLSSP